MGEFGEELVVEGFVGGFCEVGVAFGAGEFGGVFVGFFDEFFYFGAGSVVVEEFVVAFFDAWVGVVSGDGWGRLGVGGEEWRGLAWMGDETYIR